MNTISTSSDEQLMKLVQRGSEPAFNELYQRYSKRLLFFMYKMLQQDEAKAQDLLQDVFLKVVEAPEKFDHQRPFKTWIFTVAANCCKNYFRNQKTARLAQERIGVADNLVAPSSPKEQEGLDQHLQEALQKLSVVYREVFILKYKEGLSLKEIAAILDCPLGTIKSRLHAATKKLAQELAPYKAQLKH
ncbi:MAG: RNA polymerase sigma factor [Aureispira sp.]